MPFRNLIMTSLSIVRTLPNFDKKCAINFVKSKGDNKEKLQSFRGYKKNTRGKFANITTH